MTEQHEIADQLQRATRLALRTGSPFAVVQLGDRVTCRPLKYAVKERHPIIEVVRSPEWHTS